MRDPVLGTGRLGRLALQGGVRLRGAPTSRGAARARKSRPRVPDGTRSAGRHVLSRLAAHPDGRVRARSRPAEDARVRKGSASSKERSWPLAASHSAATRCRRSPGVERGEMRGVSRLLGQLPDAGARAAFTRTRASRQHKRRMWSDREIRGEGMRGGERKRGREREGGRERERERMWESQQAASQPVVLAVQQRRAHSSWRLRVCSSS